MGTSVVSPRPRQAGEHAQERADRLRRRLLVAVAGSFAVTGISFVALGGHGLPLVAIEVVALAAMLLAIRVIEPIADRWGRSGR